MHLLSATYKLSMKYFNQQLPDDVWVKFRAGERRGEAASESRVRQRNVPLTSTLQLCTLRPLSLLSETWAGAQVTSSRCAEIPEDKKKIECNGDFSCRSPKQPNTFEAGQKTAEQL